jgi:hypothetical protein
MTETALQAEAAGPTAEFEFRGEKFTVPLEYADYPVEYIEAAEDGKSLAIQARGLLGPEQWDRVRSMRLKARDLDELSDAISAALGVEPGESTPSSA